MVQIQARFPKEEADGVDRFTRTLSSYLNTAIRSRENTRPRWGWSPDRATACRPWREQNAQTALILERERLAML